MTEQEALTKWCPFSRAANKENGTGDVSIGGMNRWRGEELLPKGTRCLGSACMAWRETHMVTDANVDPRDGYCGLAGKA